MRGGLPVPAPEIPPLQRTAHFPSAFSTSVQRHLNIGDFWRYCQNKRILTTTLLAQILEPPFPHCGSTAKSLNSLYWAWIIDFETSRPRLGLRDIWNKSTSNERAFPVDPNPGGEAGTRPWVAELLCSITFRTCLTTYLFSFTRS